MPDNPITTEEIDALMQAVQSGQVASPAGPATMAGSTRLGRATVRPYDFARPDRFSREQMRALETVGAGFARALTTPLAGLLRATVDVEPESLQDSTFGAFLEALPANATVALVSMAPLAGRGVMSLDPGLAFALVDRLLGGPGRAMDCARDLTEIERGLIGRVLERACASLSEAWSAVVPMKANLETIIASTLFGQVASPDDRFMVAGYVVRFGEATGRLSLGIPTSGLDPVLKKMSAQPWLSASLPSGGQAAIEHIRQTLERMSLDLTVRLGRAAVTVRDLLDLQAGDVIRLDGQAGADLDVLVGPKVRFRGQPGQVGRRLGIRIDHVVNGDE